jgi:heme-degrading monooxygenase HmoA
MPYVNSIDWHVHPFRADRWLEIWMPALERARAFGASRCYLTRDIDDPLHFRQVSFWEDKADFERYWFSDEIAALREAAVNYFNKPLLPGWSSLVADAGAAAARTEVVAEAGSE